MPRITTVDERNNFESAQISQILVFWTPVLSGSYDVWGGTHDTNPPKMKDNLSHIDYLPHRYAGDNLLCSTGKETFFLTDSSRSNAPLRFQMTLSLIKFQTSAVHLLHDLCHGLQLYINVITLKALKFHRYWYFEPLS